VLKRRKLLFGIAGVVLVLVIGVYLAVRPKPGHPSLATLRHLTIDIKESRLEENASTGDAWLVRHVQVKNDEPEDIHSAMVADGWSLIESSEYECPQCPPKEHLAFIIGLVRPTAATCDVFEGRKLSRLETLWEQAKRLL
jgi:hypothetical protein